MAAKRSPVREYAVITAAYWAFTLTDGALRMLVLLYLHDLGRSPMQIAGLFLFYEFFGVVTNFVGGWLASRTGLRRTLLLGLTLQVVACGMLGGMDANLTLPLVMVAQALSGVAKDLTKMSAKSYIKTVAPTGDSSGLMRWVAWLTGSKNTLKGVGFFLGGWLLSAYGFRAACVGMASGVAVVAILSRLLLPAGIGKSSKNRKLSDLVRGNLRLRWLSAARLFLFAARDVWFVLALPLYLSSQWNWSHGKVGAFLALWVIGYGFVQAASPWYLSKGGPKGLPGAGRLGLWTLSLVLPMVALVQLWPASAHPAWVMVGGLALFGALFATCSALHSYLVIEYADGDKVAAQVGVYYTANALGRFLGTILSGVLYQAAGEAQTGLVWCLWGAVSLVGVSALFCIPLFRAERVVRSGS
ncbi:MAG: organoarsenical effux MFS transporter ArsJ [Planctomycetes bacterium]|nr:organoarsenical effux MFS transporter ArsJ [Planctomycetota bacterium]